MSLSMDSDSFPSPDFNNNNNNNYHNDPSRKYALSGRIMLTAIIILFFVVILMIILHLYARWYLLRVQRRRRRRRTTHLVFYMDPAATSSIPVSATSHGLDQDVLKRLPVFTYMQDPEGGRGCVECAVCLCEFEENERGRLLPKCGHVFHTECIDMWFHSHSTCPLCRDAVELVEAEPEDIVACVECSSMKVEQDESPTSSGGPLSRMLSFSRILSREGRRSESCGGDAGVDVEVGRETSPSHQVDSV